MNRVTLFEHPTQLGSTINTRLDKGQLQREQVRPQSKNENNLDAIIAKLQTDLGSYKYTVYRCAKKFVNLQKVFNTSKIPYKLVLAVLARHDMHTCADNNNLMVPPFQLTTLLHDIYFACEKLGHLSEWHNYKLDAAVALLANFFWNIYDPHRRHSISLLEIKVTFLLLCKLDGTETLVTEFYALVADAKTKCVSKFCFEYLVNIISKVFTYIGEGKAYGAHNLQQVMEQCYSRCHNNAGLTEYQFHCLWTRTQTRFLIYANLIALIKRIEDTEHLIHNNSCSGCRMERITGIRFKCQVCRDLCLCFECFASGFTTNNHTIVHRMFEVFVDDQPPKKLTYYLARICCFFKSKEGMVEEAKRFCNSDDVASTTKTLESKTIGKCSMCTNSINSNGMPEVTTAVAASKGHAATVSTVTQQQAQQQELYSLTGLATTATHASQRLQSIIDQLLKQNAKLEAQLHTVSTSTHEEITHFLSAHQAFLVEIIDEMRNLSHNSTTSSVTTTTTTSTPFRQPTYLFNAANANTDNLTHSINGADLNRSYLEANKSDYSLNDLSLWFDQQRATTTTTTAQSPAAAAPADILTNELDASTTEMVNFKLLLSKVKAIVEDSYSDNAELSAATQNLENALDVLIHDEEQRRCST